jgi:hypothetical protein
MPFSIEAGVFFAQASLKSQNWMTGTQHCPQLLVDMGSHELFTQIVLDP